jgi:thymidine phosphorylase
VSAIGIGNAAVHLGAGRRTKEDTIDHSVGIVCRVKRGAHVHEGDVLAEIHARTDADAEAAADEVLDAYELSEIPVLQRPILLDVIG